MEVAIESMELEREGGDLEGKGFSIDILVIRWIAAIKIFYSESGSRSDQMEWNTELVFVLLGCEDMYE